MPSSYVSGRVMSDQTEHSRAIIVGYVPSLLRSVPPQVGDGAVAISSHFALHKGIAIGFLRATGFRNQPKRTIVDVWCGDPYLAFTYVAFPFLK